MLQSDLDHQAGVMYAIHTFVDVCLNLDMPNGAFIFNLERLWSAFEVFKQEGVEYAASIRAFIAVTEFVNSQRGMLSFGEYLSEFSIGEIKGVRRITSIINQQTILIYIHDCLNHLLKNHFLEHLFHKIQQNLHQ